QLSFDRTYEYSNRHTYQLGQDGSPFCYLDGKLYFQYAFMPNIIGNFRGKPYQYDQSFQLVGGSGHTLKMVVPMSAISDAVLKLPSPDYKKNEDVFETKQPINDFYRYLGTSLYHSFRTMTTASPYDDKRLIACGVATFDPE